MGSPKTAANRPTMASLQSSVESLQEDNKKLTARLYELEHVTKSLNIALIGFAYTTKVKPKRLKGATADEFLKYIEEHVHPVIRRADELTGEIAEKAKSEIAKQAKESQNGVK